MKVIGYWAETAHLCLARMRGAKGNITVFMSFSDVFLKQSRQSLAFTQQCEERGSLLVQYSHKQLGVKYLLYSLLEEGKCFCVFVV